MAQCYEIILIPNQAQSFNIVLNRKDYRFEIRWNTVAMYWVLDISNPNTQEPLVRGIPMIPGGDLLQQYRYLEIDGELIVMTRAEGQTPSDHCPGYGDLGVDSRLYFLTDERMFL